MSRQWIRFENFPTIEKAVTALGLHSIVLDGEIHGDELEDVALVARCHYGDDSALTYTLWDILPLAEWESGEYTHSRVDRRMWLARIAAASLLSRPIGTYRLERVLALTTGRWIEDRAELDAYYSGVIEHGGEGIVAKSNAVYTPGLSREWIKLKPRHERKTIWPNLRRKTTRPSRYWRRPATPWTC